MMQANTVQLDMSAVKVKTAVGLIFNFTQSDLLCIAVDHFTVLFKCYR